MGASMKALASGVGLEHDRRRLPLNRVGEEYFLIRLGTDWREVLQTSTE